MNSATALKPPGAPSLWQRWRVLGGLGLWTIGAVLVGHWLLQQTFDPSQPIVIRPDATEAWSERISNWLLLAHLNFYPGYAWLLFAPYVIWLGMKFHLTPRNWRWRLPLLLLVGAGFVMAAQAFTQRLSRQTDSVVVVSTIMDAQSFFLDDPNSEPANFHLEVTEEPPVDMVMTTNRIGNAAHVTTVISGHFADATAKGRPHAAAPDEEQATTYAPPTDMLTEGMMLPAERFRGRTGWDAIAYLGLLGLAHAGVFQRRYRERERRATQLESQLNAAQLRALQAQLQPHFLFNTLNGIATLVRRNPAAAEEMITSLSELLRLALHQSDRQEIQLRDELDFLNRYLEIQQMRFGDRLTVERAIDPAASDCAVPALLLQPLVENAIRHGIEPATQPGTVEVSAHRQGDRLELVVADNGVGLGMGRSSSGSGVGLKNVRERLATLYPGQHEFEFGTRPEGGVLVRITLPWRNATAITPEAAG